MSTVMQSESTATGVATSAVCLEGLDDDDIDIAALIDAAGPTMPFNAPQESI